MEVFVVLAILALVVWMVTELPTSAVYGKLTTHHKAISIRLKDMNRGGGMLSKDGWNVRTIGSPSLLAKYYINYEGGSEWRIWRWCELHRAISERMRATDAGRN